MSLWQNGVAARLIGSIRRESTDHIIALGEARLRRPLKCYAVYYNAARTHRSLNKNARYRVSFRTLDASYRMQFSGDRIIIASRTHVFGTHSHTMSIHSSNEV